MSGYEKPVSVSLLSQLCGGSGVGSVKPLFALSPQPPLLLSWPLVLC